MSSSSAAFDGGPLHEATARVPNDEDGGALPDVVVVESDDGYLSAYVLMVARPGVYRYDGAASESEAARCPRIQA